MRQGKPQLSVCVRILVEEPRHSMREIRMLEPTSEGRTEIQFDLLPRLKAMRQDRSANFIGESAQGTPADRFS